MKKYIFLLISCSFLSAFTYAQTSNIPADTKIIAKKMPKISFKQVEHDFGNIPQGKPVSIAFEFKNTGKTPLILSHVQASCGCTVPQYSKEPVLPGKTGTIQIEYNAATVGAFAKTITVTSNADEPSKILTIRGTVVE